MKNNNQNLVLVDNRQQNLKDKILTYKRIIQNTLIATQNYKKLN